MKKTTTEIQWICITTTMFDDEKIKIIESMPDRDAILIIWIKLLCLAGKANAAGFLLLSETIPYNDEMLSALFNRPLQTIRLALATFKSFGMIEYQDDSIVITNYLKYQFGEKLDKIREQNRDRIQRFRERRQEQLELLRDCNVTGNGGETQGNALEGEEDKEGERDKPQGADIPFTEIVDLYHQLLPELPKVRVVGDALKSQLRGRWQALAERRNLDWWRKLFEDISKSDFLMGRTKEHFTCTLHWISGRENLEKILNGQYSRNGRKDEKGGTVAGRINSAEHHAAESRVKF